MNLNITFIFQIFNFFIAYFLLERFFFRSAFGVVQRRDESMRLAEDSLITQKRNLENVRIHVVEQWQGYQRALCSDIPHKIPAPVGVILDMQAPTGVYDKNEERQLSEKLENAILSRFISHKNLSPAHHEPHDTKKSS